MSQDVPQELDQARQVAVVGMAGRFPGAADIEQFWQNLLEGKESLTELDDETMLAAGVARSDLANPGYVRLSPVLDDVDLFDARLFGYHPREAQVADPQQRVFLEVCHTALEHAGCDPVRHPGKIGVFAGGAPNEYSHRNVFENISARDAVGDVSIEINNASDYVATRVAYALGLRGPAVSVQTACSTAMVAVHMARRAIQAGECDVALAGGVNIRIPAYKGHIWAEDSIFSPDGHIRTFDAQASGTNFGHGAGVVVLKDLEQARADGNTIYAVVLGSATNNDGASRASFSAPSEEGQRDVITMALRDAGDINPDTIGYVEAHGTGTLVGDPIEVNALSRAYRDAGAEGRQRIPIGSVKTNIGHLGAAAAMPSLIKAMLAMKHGQIPGTINFDTPNPRIDFDSSPFHVARKGRPWPRQEGPKRVAVSAFGIGGTNAHLILEEPPTEAAAPDDRTQPRWQVLALSAKSEAALKRRRDDLVTFLREHPEVDLADVAHTLQQGRTEHGWRTAVVARDAETAVVALADSPVEKVAARTTTETVLLFTGQGSQYVGMARGLYASEPVFAAVVDECCDLLTPHLGVDLREVVFAEPTDEAEELLRQTRITQPALFVVEHALAELWASWGLEPVTTLGHSVGELVAAHRAGVFTLPAVLELVATRGRLIQSMPSGAMLALPLAEADVRAVLPDSLDVAAVNAPKATVVAGPHEEIAAFEQMLAQAGVHGTALRTSHAFHSSMLDPVVEPLRQATEAARPQAPRTPFVSTVTGELITDAQASDPHYWAQQARRPVRFADAVRTAAGRHRVLLEVGPGRTLAAMAAQALAGDETASPTVSSLGETRATTRDDAQSIRLAAARLWAKGVPLAWAATHQDPRPRLIALPTYPFEHQRFWTDAEEATVVPGQIDLTGLDEAAQVTNVPMWRQRRLPREDVDVLTAPYLVFTPGTGPAELLAAELESRGVTVVRVLPGEGFGDGGGGRFTVDPTSRDDYVALLRALAGQDLAPGTVVHGWTATAADEAFLEPDHVQQVRDLGFSSAVMFTQALVTTLVRHELSVRFVTSFGANVSGRDRIEPAKALLRGPAKVVPIEEDHLTAQLIDIEGEDDVARLLAEVLAPVSASVVAFRGGRRWVEDFEPAVDLPGPVELPRSLRRRGVYLVTGGLGDLGLRVAEELARCAAARLVLMGRTPLPPRETWDAVLAAGTDQRLARTIHRIRSLENLGAEVLTVAADVADADQMQAALLEVGQRFGRVNGVFHAAGIAGAGRIEMKTLDRAHKVLHPKVDGLLVLRRLLGDEADLFVLFSSIIAITGGFGQVDYCAANSFMDAFAQADLTGRATVHTVNFCGWEGIGMLASEYRESGIVTTDDGGVRSSLPGTPADAAVTPSAAGLLGERVLDSEEPLYTAIIGPDWHWALTEHQMGDQQVFPGTAYVDMIAAACRHETGSDAVELRDVLFGQLVRVDGPRELRVHGTPTGHGTFDFTVTSRSLTTPDAAWQRHASATAGPLDEPAPAARSDLDEVAARCDVVSWVPKIRNPQGVVMFGPHWEVIESVNLGEGEQVSFLTVPDDRAGDLDTFAVHPSLLDCGTGLSVYKPDVARDDQSFLPIAYDRIKVWGRLGPRVVSHLVRRGEGVGGFCSYDVTMSDAEGRVMVQIDGFAVRAVDVEDVHGGLEQPAADPEATASVGLAEGELLIDADRAIELLWRVLDSTGERQHVVTIERIPDKERRLAGIARKVTEAFQAAEFGSFARPQTRAATVRKAGGEPATPTEEKLLRLWREAFAIDDLGVEEDFFELGGNSLVAVQLAVRIREEFGVDIAGVAVLEYSTVRTLAGLVDTTAAEMVEVG